MKTVELGDVVQSTYSTGQIVKNMVTIHYSFCNGNYLDN